MVRVLEWSGAARRQFNDGVTQDSRVAKVAADQVEARVGRLMERPFDCRQSRWPGFRELSVLRWRKIVVYDVTDTQIIVVAFYDSRQDLSAVSPKPE